MYLGVYLMLGPGMVCSVGIPAACMTPVSALLSPVSRDCGGGVTGPQRRQQQQTTAPAAMFCCCGCCGGGDQRLGRWPCLPATDCFLVSLQLVLYQYWVTGLPRMLSSRTICILAGSLVNIRRAVSWNGGLHLIKRSWNWVTKWSVNRPVKISNPVDWDTCCIFHAHPAPCPGWLCDVWQLVIGVRLLRSALEYENKSDRICSAATQ